MENLINSRLEFLRSRIGEDMSESISPFGRWLNGTIRAVEHGRLIADFRVRQDMTNPANVLHGGVASAILDELIGIMVYSLGYEYAYTSVNLSIDFLHAARLNNLLTASAILIRAGKNIVHCEGSILTDDGKIVAKCATNLIQTSTKLPF